MKRMAVARLWHEGNSFTPVPTTLDAFRAREWSAGEAAREFYRGTATEIGAAVTFAEEADDWRVSFLRCAAAPPGGPVRDTDFHMIARDILDGLLDSRWDGVYLSLHGALVTDERPRPERDLLRAVRRAIGPARLAVSFDLHANLGPEVTALADIAVGYKTYPHTDMAQTGAKALRLLAGTVDGRIRPAGALAKAGAILTSFNMRTTDGPMAEVAALAAAWQARPGILDATVFGGFAYGDTPDAGAAALVYADGDAELARRAAGEIAAALSARRDRFAVHLPDPDAGLDAALAAPPGLVAVLDPADNPMSGGIGDTPALLRALLARRVAVPAVFAFLWDPPLVARAHDEGVGAEFEAPLGGRITDAFGPPVAAAVRVRRLTDGHFRNQGPMEAGLPVALGRTAVLDVDGVQLIVTESCQSPNDAAYFALHGIDLTATRLLCVKAKNHFRAAFGPLCAALVAIDAPGPACADLSLLAFRHAPAALLPSPAGPGGPGRQP
jgi:microcystin degradation protein MlrC